MKHRTTPQFWQMFERLPLHIQKLERKNFRLLKADPKHSSLHFKKVGSLWSDRVGTHYRVLGFDHDGSVLWFWVDSHAQYDKMMP